MRGYGLPRNDDVANPDVADIKKYGLKTSAGGRDYFKNKRAKRAIRRIYKRTERQKNKVKVRDYENF